MKVNYRVNDKPGVCTVRVPSPNTTVRQIRQLFAIDLKANAQQLRLIYRGKELEDAYTLFQCDFRNEDTVLVLLKAVLQEELDIALVLPNVSRSEISPECNEDKAPLDSEVAKKTPIDDKGKEDMEFCDHCRSTASKECKECGCNVCGGKGEEERTLICDECDYYYHIYCLAPKLTKLPDGDWYCPACANDPSAIVTPGQKLALSKKKAKMPSATATKDWGRGMACAGVTKKCTVVGPDHVGPIPGVPVGSSWRFRQNVSESGVHRPPVAGIAGKASTGAVSLVLAAGYPEDEDKGAEFTYTGAGGRDLKDGNKRVGKQTCDQEMKGVNEALARTCDCSFNIRGNTASNWRNSRGIRVVRSYKLKKHNSGFAPAEGNRYDGIYKLVKYWPERGKAGFLVWRYLMRRDDPEPAPWTDGGKRRTKELGLVMYDADAEQVVDKSYRIPQELLEQMDSDTANMRSWDIIRQRTLSSFADLLNAVEDVFVCPICKDKVQSSVTTSCTHNACQDCLLDAFRNNGRICPTCRTDLTKEEVHVNTKLERVFASLINPSGGGGGDRSERPADCIGAIVPNTKSNSEPATRTRSSIRGAAASKRNASSSAESVAKKARSA